MHWPLEAPPEYVARFANTTGGNPERKMVCAMAAFLDDAVGNVTAALRDAGISMESMLQRGRGRSPGEAVPVVLTTHETRESAMRLALARIAELNTVLEAPAMIRIEAA